VASGRRLARRARLSCTGREIANWSHPRPPFPLETSVPGIFAAGDVRSASVKRVAAGVGKGSMVISFVHQYLAGDA
jgi:thioredoxin reductase (NADPH)